MNLFAFCLLHIAYCLLPIVLLPIACSMVDDETLGTAAVVANAVSLQSVLNHRPHTLRGGWIYSPVAYCAAQCLLPFVYRLLPIICLPGS